MVKKEYVAYSYDEAVAAAEADGFKVRRNKTVSWEKAGRPLGDKELKVFAVEQLNKEKIADLSGFGVMIAAVSGSKDTRMRPYTYRNVVTKGRITTERTYEWRRNDTGEVVLTLSGEGATQDKAIKMAKEAMPEIKADLTLEIVYRVKDGKNVVGYLDYTPSVNTEAGKYIFLGNERF